MEKANHSLNQFPPEVLDLILGSKTSSYLALRLWSCGNSILKSKLSSGITYMNLKAGWSLQTGFPPMLLKLPNLRYLSIKVTGNLMRHPLEWKGLILSLPSTLETLKIDCSDCDFCLRNFAPEWTETAPLYIETTYPMGTSNLFDISQQLPRLTRLKICGTKQFFACDLPSLPSTITDLKFEGIQRQGFRLMMSSLPRSLVRLRTTVVGPADSVGIADWLNCPPNLTRIDKVNEFYPQTNYAWLPRSLKHVTINGAQRLPFNFSDTAALTLPSSYESIVFNLPFNLVEHNGPDISASWASKVSPRLTTLDVTTPERSAFDAHLLRYLPHTLTDLTINFEHINWIGLPSRLEIETADPSTFDSGWPPHLLSLALRGIISCEDFYRFPRTLSKLSVTLGNGIHSARHEGYVSIKSKDLPPNLTQMTLRGFGEDTDIIGPLPETLQHLELLEYLRPNAVSTLHYKLLIPQPLPQSITFLSAGLTQNRLALWLPPPCLTRLCTSHLLFTDFESLPRTLTSLVISDLEGPPLQRHVNLTYGLPSSLVKLIIYKPFYFASLLTPDSFANLPLLKEMNIHQDIIVPSAAIRNLSRHLKHLKIEITDLKEEDASFLPPYLESLNLGFLDMKIPLGQYWPLAAINKKLWNEEQLAILEQRKRDLGLHSIKNVP